MYFNFIAGASPAKSSPVVNTKKRQSADSVSEHHGTSKPAWLLALEVVTGTMVGSLVLVSVLVTLQRCNNKSSLIMPWRKSTSQKDHMAVYIGLVSLLSTASA